MNTFSKQEARDFLCKNLQMEDEGLKTAICDHIMQKYEADIQSWEQLRYLKQSADTIHKAVGELVKVVIKKKSQEIMRNMPQPSKTKIKS